MIVYAAELKLITKLQRKLMKINWAKELSVDIVTLDEVKKAISTTEDYYVYILWKMYNDAPEPFYVGKGHLQRIIKHGMQSEEGINIYKDRVLNKHKTLGIDFGYTIIDFFGDEESALKLEMELISIIGRADLSKGPLTNKTDGGDGTRGRLAPKGGYSHSARPVFADGNRFPCLDDAARALNVSGGAISSRIRNGWDGYFYEDEGQRPQTKKILGRYKKEVVVQGTLFSSAAEASRALDMDVRMISKRISWGWEGYYYTEAGQLPRRSIWASREDKVPVSIRGIEYESISAAAAAIGEGSNMIYTRCLSTNYPEYSRLDGKKIHKSNPPRKPRRVIIDGIIYDSLGQAGASFSLTEGGVLYRCKSTQWSNWRFFDDQGKDTNTLTPQFSSKPINVVVDGINYESQSQAALAYNLSVSDVKRRCRSMAFPGWICDSIKKQPTRDNKPSLISIEIDGVKYRSINSASTSTGIDRAKIKKRLASEEWPSYRAL